MKRIGVLLVNLGTPDAPEKASVRAYLREFLMDKHVLNIPFPIRFFLVYFIIVPKRLSAVTELYKTIWEQDSPIRSILLEQTRKLQSLLKSSDEYTFFVEAAMTYGEPSIKQAVKNLQEKGIERLIVLPLYPQYSKTTTFPVKERVEKALEELGFNSNWKMIEHYYQHSLYTQAIVEQIKERWSQEKEKPDLLLLSYHGIPVSYVKKGDPYHEHCKQTTIALQKALSDYGIPIQESFQSRVTSQEWLQPYTEVTLSECPSNGIKNVEVYCPGFSADCLETLEEVAIQYKKLFLSQGGDSYFAYPALNARDLHINMMEDLVKNAVESI